MSSEGSHDKEWPPWRSSLLTCLDGIQTTGDFSWAHSYAAFVNPGLEIDGHGQIPLPLGSGDAQAIKQASRPAPFGKGDQTLVDDAVRKTWELDRSQVRLVNPQWQAFLDHDVLGPASRKLGLTHLEAKLHKLLLYEPGSFFKRHKDSQKEPGMVGTLVVCLPSEHEGGDVHLSFKQTKRTHQTAPTSRFDLTALAWFGDVAHEVAELVSGYRLVLTFNLVVPMSGGSPRSAAFFDEQTEKLQRILADWRDADNADYTIYYPLDHQYSDASLSLGHLKGRDAAVCQLLHRTAPEACFSFFLANMTHVKERMSDEYYCDDDDDEWKTVDRVHTADGTLVFRNMALHERELLCLRRAYGNDDAADEHEGSRYLGNEHSPERFLYKNTIAVLWAKPRLVTMLGLKGGDVMVDAMIAELTKDLHDRRDDDGTVASATQFMKACCGKFGQLPKPFLSAAEQARLGLGENKTSVTMPFRKQWGHWPTRALPAMIEWGLELGDHALYEAAVNAGEDQPSVQKTIARHIEDDCAKRSGSQEFTSGDWDQWLGAVVKNGRPLASLQSCLDSFESAFGNDRLKASFCHWKEAVLASQLETKPQMDTGDAPFVLQIMSAHHDDTAWLTSFLAKVCPRGTRPFLTAILDKVLVKDAFPPDAATALFGQVLEAGVGVFSLQPPAPTLWCDCPGIWDDWNQTELLKLLDRALDFGLTDAVCAIVRRSNTELQTPGSAGKKRWANTEFKTREWLGNFGTMMEKHKAVLAPTTAAFKALFETVFKLGVLCEAPIYPKERFKGWAYPARGCGVDSCVDCKELRDFMGSETRTMTHFPVPYMQQQHIKEQLRFSEVECKEEWERRPTEAGGTELVNVLVVNKTQTVFQRDVERYEREVDSLNGRVKPLQVEHIEKLLGGEAYRELVLLEGLRTRGADAQEEVEEPAELSDRRKRRKMSE